MTDKLFENNKIIINGEEKELDESGLKIINRDPGTAYHCPEGILFIYGDKNINLLFQNMMNPYIDTTKIAPFILDYFDVEIPNYMKFKNLKNKK